MTKDAHVSHAPDAFVVIAEFVVKEGLLDTFLSHAMDDAQHSLSDEVDCLQFDVLRTSDSGNGVLFYEVYRSKTAFETHLETPHVQKFRSILAKHVAAERPVRMLTRS